MTPPAPMNFGLCNTGHGHRSLVHSALNPSTSPQFGSQFGKGTCKGPRLAAEECTKLCCEALGLCLRQKKWAERAISMYPPLPLEISHPIMLAHRHFGEFLKDMLNVSFGASQGALWLVRKRCDILEKQVTLSVLFQRMPTFSRSC